MLEQACWAIGCVNMAVSMVFSAIGHHKKSLDEAGKASMHRACNIHQIASLGFMVLAHTGTDGVPPMIPLLMLSVATVLFPGVIYYKTLSGNKEFFMGRFVPMGGLLHMAFWCTMALYFKSSTTGSPSLKMD